jgi:hypothetical protein
MVNTIFFFVKSVLNTWLKFQPLLQMKFELIFILKFQSLRFKSWCNSSDPLEFISSITFKYALTPCDGYKTLAFTSILAPIAFFSR